MTILDKHSAYRHAHDTLLQHGVDPLNVRFDSVLSPTEGMLGGRRTILLGTNNYLGLTFDADCIEKSVEATRSQGTGTTGSRVANGTYDGHAKLEGGAGGVLRPQAGHGVQHRLSGQSRRPVGARRSGRSPDAGRRQPRQHLRRLAPWRRGSHPLPPQQPRGSAQAAASPGRRARASTDRRRGHLFDAGRYRAPEGDRGGKTRNRRLFAGRRSPFPGGSRRKRPRTGRKGRRRGGCRLHRRHLFQEPRQRRRLLRFR